LKSLTRIDSQLFLKVHVKPANGSNPASFITVQSLSDANANPAMFPTTKQKPTTVSAAAMDHQFYSPGS
jgi:hypothetical protein